MVIGAFPIAKLAVLLIRQISKPLANTIKDRAKDHPFFRKHFCIPPAQLYNWCEVKAKMWVLNLGKPVNIPVLSEEMATELGANLLGEAIIFIIAATLLLIEYNRQAEKEAAKEAAKQAEMNRITSGISDLYLIVHHHQAYLTELEQIVYSFSGKKPNLPPLPNFAKSPTHETIPGEGTHSDKPSRRPPSGGQTQEPIDNLEQLSTGQIQRPARHTGPTDAEKIWSLPVFNQRVTPQSLLELSSTGQTQGPATHNGHEEAKRLYSTPVPNQGLILQSLNYIEQDVFCSFFLTNYKYDD